MAHKIIIAPDKFKGSLTGIEFCTIVEKGIKSVISDIEIQKLPLADGGDGTVEVLQYYRGGEMVSVKVENPFGTEIDASYLYSESGRMAFIEMAEASGIRLLSNEQLNPLKTSTFGTGQLIEDAINRGAKYVILGIGGSATNDAGMGMARALGFRFYDADNNELDGKGEDLQKLSRIDNSRVNNALTRVSFEVACDVENPLFGENGAAAIYGPQKGADDAMVKGLDLGLQNFNAVVKSKYQKDLQQIKGAGAAGGLGAGSAFFLNATLKPGIDLVKAIAAFDQQIVDADWIITGEGKFDEQTFSGKVIKGVIDSITSQKMAIFCGISELDNNQLKANKVDYIDEMMTYASDMEDSIAHSERYLTKAAIKFAKVLK